MTKWTIMALLVLLLGPLAAACTQAGPGAGGRGPAAGQAEWDRVVAEARKEGVVRVYTLWTVEAREALNKGFKDKYGISVEFSPFSRGSDFLAKVQAEQRAGMYEADVFGAGATSLITTMKPPGLLGNIEPMLLLPEVKDAKAWRDGVFPFLDEGKTTIAMIGMILPTIIYNKDLIKEGEITSVKDLLKSQYNGKITMNDPSVPGSGNAVLALLADWAWNREEALEFFRQLMKQGLDIQRDNRMNVEIVARGKFALGLGPHTESLAHFLSAGAPLGIANIKEPPNGTASSGGLAVPTQSPHPNAAKVFVNWLLTKEGQSIFARSYGNPSRRIDASTEGINPIFIPQPGQKVYWDIERTIMGKGKMMADAKAIMAETK